jgi:hypothetical protein
MNQTSDIPLPDAARGDIDALARRMTGAMGPAMRVLTYLGGGIENRLERLPDRVKDAIESGAGAMLEQAYHAARVIGGQSVVPKTGAWAHKVAAIGSGAAGGIGGLSTALLEMPATVALIFGAMQKIAAENGFDPVSEDTRLTCLEIFGAGGPGARDDGVNSTFLGTRIGLNGSTLSAVISRIAPRFAATISQKFAAQVVPVLGAAAGAGVNYAFMDYYQEMARVRFGLKRLAQAHGEDAVMAAFRRAVSRRGDRLS